jgi:hypothetical protein
MSWLPYLCVLIVLALVQMPVRRALGPAVKIGDESGYVKCGALADPYCPGQFLRVPLMAWLSLQAHRFSSNPERFLRLATSLASAMTILISMLSAQMIGGVQAALLIGLLLVFMPGRIILSHHIWPDIWLGLWLSLACLLLIYPDLSFNLRALSLGTVAALAFLTRFDALLMAPFAGIALVPLPFQSWVVILLPTLVMFAVLSIRNARRYGIPWPDNTWMLNLMIAAGETWQEKAAGIEVQRQVLKVFADWSKLTQADRQSVGFVSLATLLKRPVQAISGVFLRLWAGLGPDSFVLQRLLPPIGKAYPGISRRILPGLQIALNFAFPIFISLTILALLVAGPPAPVILWPGLALFAATLINNRNRYRQAWLPAAALLLVSAMSAPGFWPALLSAESIPAWIFSAGLAMALVCFRVRPEMEGSP